MYQLLKIKNIGSLKRKNNDCTCTSRQPPHITQYNSRLHSPLIWLTAADEQTCTRTKEI